MSTATFAPTPATQHELRITRVFNAPRSAVWKAWTDSEQAKQWSGPRGFTLMHAHHDIRPGGKWRGCLHRDHPDKGCGDRSQMDLWQEGLYLEVVPEERLVFTFRWDNRDGQPTPETTVTISFEEHNGKTTMHFHQAFFKTAEDHDGHRGGWNSSFDRLEDHLATTAPKEYQHAQHRTGSNP
jgi:uncharacterized protein YndB with AHSA1/START domain